MRLKRPIKTRCRFGSLSSLTLPHTVTRWLILQKARCHKYKYLLQLLVSIRFQVLFHSPSGVLFTFPSRYWFTIGHSRVFRLGGWSPQIPTGFHVSGSTQELQGSLMRFVYGALTLSCLLFQTIPLLIRFFTTQNVTLQPHKRFRNLWFGPDPRSLATTSGISFDLFSSGYLDVSVPRVVFSLSMCSTKR